MKKRAALLIAFVMALSLTCVPGAQTAIALMMSGEMTPVTMLTPAASPLYPAGTKIIIKTDHMDGMQGAVGVVSGAYDTLLYAVDYVSETGEWVVNHRWVIAEEIMNMTGRALAIGDVVTLGAGHMGGHGGTGKSATIVQISRGPAYMIDYDPTDGGERVINHQWVSEFEIEPFAEAKAN